MKLIVLFISLISFQAFAFYDCYSVSRSGKFIDIYEVSSNERLEVDFWDAYTGLASANNAANARNNPRSYDYYMQSEADQAFYYRFTEVGSRQLYFAENAEGETIELIITNKIARRLPNGLRDYISRYHYADDSAFEGTVTIDGEETKKVYCFR